MPTCLKSRVCDISAMNCMDEIQIKSYYVSTVKPVMSWNKYFSWVERGWKCQRTKIRLLHCCQAQDPTEGQGQDKVWSDSKSNSNSKVGPELYSKWVFREESA